MTRYLLDTNIISDLVRHPRGRVTSRIAEVGEAAICTSIIVAAELRFGAAKKASERLTSQLERVLAVLDIQPFEATADAVYGHLRAQLEASGQVMGGNDMLIAAHAIVLDAILVTDDAAFARVGGLPTENWLR